MDKSKFIIVTILLSFALIAGYVIPVERYVSTGFISNLKMPLSISEWTGNDVKDRLNLDFDKDWNKFISDALINEYTNKDGQKLVFIMLDAGNFHHPNVCFTSAGYEIKELGNTEFNISDRSIKAHTLFTTKGTESNLSFYWIVIDKNITHKWINQKLRQLYFSLFNRQRVGLMVRIDVPTKKENIQDTIKVAAQFVKDINRALPPDQADYIFGIK